MPTIKNAAVMAAVTLATLFIVMRFAPAGVAKSVGLTK